MKKYFVFLAIMICILINTNISAYMQPIHEYLFEEGVNLLNKYKTYNIYQDDGNNPFYNAIREGSSDEDDSDWIYGYGTSAQNPYITGIDDIPEWIVEGYLKTITHFWDADNLIP
ncbi:MAG: hypothetical protein U9P79_07450 [Candidatus Cloacimonadota bacterium]|nr:hypothetical protein [Candidatus Cloacimonadota bacterium]